MQDFLSQFSSKVFHGPHGPNGPSIGVAKVCSDFDFYRDIHMCTHSYNKTENQETEIKGCREKGMTFFSSLLFVEKPINNLLQKS